MKQTIINWAGPAILLLAYGLLSARFIDSGYHYQLLNILGSVFIIASLWSDRKVRLSLIVFNLFWIAVAVVGIIKLMLA